MREVLLIEGQWQARAFITAQLKEEGYQVTPVPTFQEGVALLCARPHLPDVVILDTYGQRFPPEKWRDFRKLLGDTPLIICTGPYHRKELDLDTLKPERLLMRPFTVQEVVEAVKSVLPAPSGTEAP